jgi:hypothetical protein
VREWSHLMISFERNKILTVSTRSWHQCSVTQLSIIEPFLLGLKVTSFLDYLNSCLLNSLIPKVSYFTHLLLDLIKTLTNFILARTWNKVGCNFIGVSSILVEILMASNVFTLSIHHGLEWFLAIKEIRNQLRTYTEYLFMVES